MKLREALRILNEADLSGEALFQVQLACGFTPLHLATFLGAHLQESLPGRRVRVIGGLYGDLAGTLEREFAKDTEAIAVALEWPDLDSRLGYRSLGGWGPAAESEIGENVRAALVRIGDAIERLSASALVALSLPSLPLPPLFHPPGWQAGEAELEIWAALMNFAASLVRHRRVSVVSPQRLVEQSLFGGCLDLKGDLLTGHPYSVSHADVVGATLARLLQPPSPKKGLITDLDDTLWSGIVGEVGSEAVAWDLGSHAQIHGLYQQTLAALSGQGVLLAVASKNDLQVVKRAFTRQDIVLDVEKVFPMEVNWGPKSESVGRILAAWNIGADAAVFIDDSPMEIAEVKATWPEMQCLLFPKDDPAAALSLMREVRDLFGKSRLAEEDGLRLASIRTNASIPQKDSKGAPQETFLSQVRAVLTAQFDPRGEDPRTIELVNKTNQFNLNGIRYTELEWRRAFDSACTFVLVVSYKDNYGPLGKVAVLAGSREDRVLHLKTWVMSCRAFSRRVEYGCMNLLFSRFEVDELRFDFTATSKNIPFRECFAPFLGAAPERPFIISRAQFEEHCPRLYHEVEIIE